MGGYAAGILLVTTRTNRRETLRARSPVKEKEPFISPTLIALGFGVFLAVTGSRIVEAAGATVIVYAVVAGLLWGIGWMMDRL
jgi:hypothetical protein